MAWRLFTSERIGSDGAVGMTIVAGTAFQFLNDQCFEGIHDIVNDTLNFAIFTTSANINPQTADLYTSLSDELVGSGYTMGGVQITQTVIYTPGGSVRPIMDIDDIVFSSTTWGQVPGTAAQGAVIYNTTVGPQQNKIAWILNFGSPIVTNNGDVTFRFPDPSNPAFAIVRTSG